MVRRVTTACATAFVLCLSSWAHAQEQQEFEKGILGAGLIVGEPLGVSGKLYLGDRIAIDAAIGTAFVGGGIQVHSDVLWHPLLITGSDDEDGSFVMPLFVGAGLRVLRHDRGRGADSDFHTGLRLVAGIVFDFKRNPLDVFVEVAGVIDYRSGGGDDEHSGAGVDLNAGAGVRYYF